MQISREHAVVAPLAGHLGRKILVLDIGCRWGVAEHWAAFGPNITVVGFDPDAEECARLQSADAGGVEIRYESYGLGPARGTALLHLTVNPGCSSLYAPCLETIRQRPELACAAPVGTATIPLRTLDEWEAENAIGPVDALKLDTQGSELGILQGGERVLKRVRALEVEVEFNEIYRGQPLFGDVDAFLRDRGFVLWRLGHLVHYGMAEATSFYTAPELHCFDSRAVCIPAQGGQLSWGHAYYVKRETALGGPSLDWRECLLDACLASAWGFRDLAGWQLRRALAGAPPEVAPSLREALLD
jgi:FkbM family methyltransferase